METVSVWVWVAVVIVIAIFYTYMYGAFYQWAKKAQKDDDDRTWLHVAGALWPIWTVVFAVGYLIMLLLRIGRAPLMRAFLKSTSLPITFLFEKGKRLGDFLARIEGL